MGIQQRSVVLPFLQRVFNKEFWVWFWVTYHFNPRNNIMYHIWMIFFVNFSRWQHFNILCSSWKAADILVGILLGLNSHNGFSSTLPVLDFTEIRPMRAVLIYFGQTGDNDKGNRCCSWLCESAWYISVTAGYAATWKRMRECSVTILLTFGCEFSRHFLVPLISK